MIILDAKTDYSFMRGFGTPAQWLARCKEIGVTDFCVADYCSTWGHTFFRKTFKDSGVHLMYGVQLPVVHHLDKDPRFSLVTLIATDSLAPLYELVTKANEQAYYRSRITWEQVKAFPGIVILNYVLPHHIKHPPKSAYLGVNPQTPEHMLTLTNQRVPAYAPRFPSSDTRQGYKLFQAISEGARIGEVDVDAYHMLRQSEFEMLYANVAYNGKAVKEIAKQAKADIPHGTLIVPKVYKDKAKQLRKMAMEGALGKIPTFTDARGRIKINKEYEDRLNHELAVIREKDFEDYFFFVGDIVSWAKERMLVGPGRGSAGGSLLCFLLGITTVDPLQFNTMFERFIDITRSDLPDIDVDFPDNRREEVFAYLKEKYGDKRVARLGTISEFGGKSAINDTAKATGVPYDVAREFGRYTEGVGQGVVISPARIFGTNNSDTMLSPDHYKLFEKYQQIKLSAVIDGHARHHGVHAAGVVVTQGPVTDFGSLTKEGVLTMDMRAAEEIGLVKMDALGLRTLSILQDACDMAGIKAQDLYDLDWEDQKVYAEIFNKDRVTGIFQFEGHAVRSLLKGLGKMERFDDVCALTSLARPGPLIGGAAEGWVKARRGDEEARVLHPCLEPTFGVICYQEQMMIIVRDLAGFDVPSVNGMRRAVGKKDPEKLRSYREQFIFGYSCYFARTQFGAKGVMLDMASIPVSPVELEICNNEAAELWDELCEFGSYAFNLAHAVEYGMISFMCAWLKLHFPLQFAAACLKHAADDEQGKNLLRELKEEGYEYVPFDPEKSQATWAIIDGKLYGGFDSVRGIGQKTAQQLVEKRDRDPKGWQNELTTSQRNRINDPQNTPWHKLTYFGETYGALYDNPAEFRRPYAPNGFRSPIFPIKDIPAEKGNYGFIGRVLRVSKRDSNDESRVAKRDGKKYDTNTFFLNITFEDDTGEISATINRFKAGSYAWLLDESMEDRDFFIRGNIINEGSRWIFVDNLVELKEKA